MKKWRVFFLFFGLSLSPSAYCLVNRLTCCQRSLCEWALAEGQSDPLACLSQRGKWRPWYAISGRNVQTVWLLRQAWLAVALPKVCWRNYLFGTRPEGLVLQGLVVIYLFIHLNLMHTGTFKNFQLLNTNFHRFWQHSSLNPFPWVSHNHLFEKMGSYSKVILMYECMNLFTEGLQGLITCCTLSWSNKKAAFYL